jgi:hypothetical protein
MPAFTAAWISSSRFPTPEKTIRRGEIPARRHLSSSPPETTSAPIPSSATTSRTASASFALTA